MRKKDPIFWGATSIFVSALVLAGIFQSQFWLALMIGAYLLRPTLASLGLARRYVDERQMNMNYRSSNIAFAVLLVVCIIFMVRLGLEDNHDFEMFAAAIVIGLAAKGLANVLLVRNFREAASTIIIAVGLLVALFSAAEGGPIVGVLIQAAPGLIFAALGLLSKRYPRPVGLLIIALTILGLIVILRRVSWGQLVTATVIGVPLIVAGVCLLVGDKAGTEAEPTAAA